MKQETIEILNELRSFTANIIAGTDPEYNDTLPDTERLKKIDNCLKWLVSDGVLADFTCRFLFIYVVDGEYKFIQYVEGKNQEEAEQKVQNGWIRVVELGEDLQVVYNGR